MILLDSNIVIYAAQLAYQDLRDWLEPQEIAVSALSQVEVLGYHKLSDADQQSFGEFFKGCLVMPISEAVILQAIALRQQRRLSLGDAVIAATGFVHNLPIATRNTKDFEWIEGLEVVNPFKLN